MTKQKSKPRTPRRGRNQTSTTKPLRFKQIIVPDIPPESDPRAIQYETPLLALDTEGRVWRYCPAAYDPSGFSGDEHGCVEWAKWEMLRSSRTAKLPSFISLHLGGRILYALDASGRVWERRLTCTHASQMPLVWQRVTDRVCDMLPLEEEPL